MFLVNIKLFKVALCAPIQSVNSARPIKLEQDTDYRSRDDPHGLG